MCAIEDDSDTHKATWVRFFAGDISAAVGILFSYSIFNHFLLEVTLSMRTDVSIYPLVGPLSVFEASF